MSRPFTLVDVFGIEDFSGNPLAVIADADGLTDREMQQIARWLNLSETAFLFSPTTADADYRVRIVTPAHELPFAGHPTLGSCHAWVEAGGRARDGDLFIQECGAGLIPIRRNGDGLAFAAPPLIRSGPVDEAEAVEIAKMLRIARADIIDAAWTDNGPGWVTVLLASAEAVLAVQPIRNLQRRVDIGLVGLHQAGGLADVEVRAFFSDAHGTLVEDPVTGSLNAAIAQWLFDSGIMEKRYVAAQGTCLGRTGRVRIERDAGGQVWVGGRTRTLFSGSQVHGGTAVAANATRMDEFDQGVRH